MNLTMTLLGVAIALGGCASAQMQQVDLLAEEAAIRAVVNRPDRLPFTADAVFWSGAYPRPQVGQEKVKPFNEAAMEQRRNEKTTTQIVRLEVAAAGDMAYEFFNFTLSYDRADTKQHTSFTGSGLRVWKKVAWEWQVAVAFMRPDDVPFAPREAQ
jgi:ketosteroid isomerase-like protein